MSAATKIEVFPPCHDAPLRRALVRTATGLLDLIPTALISDDAAPTSMHHLRWMLRTVIDKIDEWPTDKTARWIGFTQGVLASRGLLNVNDERDRTRPFFHQAYYQMGLDIPASRDG